jgi:LDH2 family malate/lactate/ureidoglycolate dehydrogenase
VLHRADPRTTGCRRIEVYHREGKPVPLGWGCDSTGTPTTDPAAILFGGGLCPLGGSEETGGYKGYGLGMMVEMFCGVLADAKFGPNVGATMNPNAVGRTEGSNLGECFVAVDPSKFCAGYADRLQTLVDQLHALPQAAGARGPVLVPGEKEQRNSEEHMRTAIPISTNVAQSLAELAAKTGVPLPSSLRQ